jgi:RimJ/RimL family protein N-acetyltransferase
MSLGRATSKTPRQMPDKQRLEGQAVVLEPLSHAHLDELWTHCNGETDSFTYLRYGPFPDKAALRRLIDDLSTRADQPFWAVRPNTTGIASGWLSLCDIYPTDAAIEIGSIWFSPALQRTRAAREAMFLLMSMAMDDLGYERLVWRCQAENAKSHRAAKHLGFTFEGTWRNAAIVKGYQRGVSWFSILADEWPERRDALKAWLDDGNFDESGAVKRSLAAASEARASALQE